MFTRHKVITMVLLLISLKCLGQETARKLSVYVEYNYYDGSLFGPPVRVQNYKNWEGYLGGEKLSEAEFFKIAGYEREAQKAAAYHFQKSCLIYGGGGFGLIGCAIALIPWLSKPEEDIPTKPVAIGFSMLFVGFLIELVGFQKPNCWSPVDFAVGVAGEYNQRHGLW